MPTSDAASNVGACSSAASSAAADRASSAALSAAAFRSFAALSFSSATLFVSAPHMAGCRYIDLL